MPTLSHAAPAAAPADAALVDTAPGARVAPLDMPPDEFRMLGHALVDRIADFYASLAAGAATRPVTRAEPPSAVRRVLGGGGLPAHGARADALLAEAADLVVDHSLHNGHPRFWGYITSSAAPIGALGDLLAAAVNANVGAWTLSPIASEIEAQAVRWIAELLRYPTTCGGLLVSGGNMANFVCVLAARRAKLPNAVRAHGMGGSAARPVMYASVETHTWVKKAADMFGFGLDAIREVPLDASRRMDARALDRMVREDRAAGLMPFLVIGTAGSVSLGVVDPLAELAEVCRAHDLWLHADGAYGAIAAMLDDAPDGLHALGACDSLAVDPHKWLYAPLEAGCALVRDPSHLVDAFSFTPEYYRFATSADDPGLNYYEVGPQNSRGFRALKVWLGLRQAGREGLERMVRDDCALAGVMLDAVAAHPSLEAYTHALSIATFRYVPLALRSRVSEPAVAEYLNVVNRAVLDRLQAGGDAYVSNAVVDGTFLLRACIVNFRTTRADVEALPAIVAALGDAADVELRPEALR